MQARSPQHPHRHEQVEALVTAHGLAVRSLLDALERDPTAREDLWSEVFLVAVTRSDRLAGLTDGQARGWLLQTARHVTANHVRRMQRRRAYEADLPNRTPYAAPSAEEAFLDGPGHEAERSGGVDRVLRSLGDAERDVLALQADGLSGPVIARTLGVTPTAARSRLMRARRSLRVALQAERSR